MTLNDWAVTHLAPLGITLEDARADALGGDFAPARYSTPNALSALHRLRAAATGTPTPIAAFAPAMPPTLPVTVASDPTDSHTAHIMDTSGTTVAAFADAPRVLSELGYDLSHAVYRTLVVDSAATLRRLHAAAHAAPQEPASRLIDWWNQRAEHPGTHATLIVTSILALRWAPPSTQPARASIQQWAAWCGRSTLADRPAQDTLDLARMATSSPILPGLDIMPAQDGRDYAYRRRESPQAWRRRDSRQQAAMGLTTRSQSAELFASLRLADPLVATAERLSGTVVTGTITSLRTKSAGSKNTGKTRVVGIEVGTDQQVCRHRREARLVGWIGQAWDQQEIAARGTLAQTQMSSTGRLTLSIADVVNVGATRLAVGDPITLRPMPVAERQQSQARMALSKLYGDENNWLARRATAPLTRRPVPLDVTIAAATDD